MLYFVTYCALDERTGVNPLWHSCLLLSKIQDKVDKLEVVDELGLLCFAKHRKERFNHSANERSVAYRFRPDREPWSVNS